MKEISIILPTYNERENLPLIIERIRNSLANHEYEVIVVDDNSPDGTGQLAEKLSEENPMKVIHREGKKGLASAVIAGFKSAEGENLCVMDADLQHPPEKIIDLLKEIENGNDIVIASRYIEQAGIEKWDIKRKIISKGSKILPQMIFSKVRPIKDPLSGFFLVKKNVVSCVKLNPIGYKILLEILVRGRYSRVVEIPYVFYDRKLGNSKLNIKEQINYLKHLYQLAEIEGEIKRFCRFLMVGISGVFVNEGILFLLVEKVGLNYLISSIFSIQFAILTNFTLNYLWTFNDRKSRYVSLSQRFGMFELVSIGGGIVNLGLLFILTNFFGIYYLISNLIAMGGAVIINFLGNNLWTWRVKIKD